MISIKEPPALDAQAVLSKQAGGGITAVRGDFGCSWQHLVSCAKAFVRQGFAANANCACEPGRGSLI